MFSVEDRERYRDLLVERARNDPAIVSAALVGSTASGADRWSDLDLTFGVADGTPVASVLDAWTRHVVAEFGAAVLFDLPVLSTIYRVFLFPGALQVDLSFTPAAEFGSRSPRFRLLFGEAIEHGSWPSPSTEHEFGVGVHHLVRARVYIERGKLAQAEHWIHEARYQALTLACARRGLNTSYGRGFDSLPPEVLDDLAGALVRELTVEELQRALAVAAAGLLQEASELPAMERTVRANLGEGLRASRD